METVDRARGSNRRSGSFAAAASSGIHRSGVHKAAPVTFRLAYLLSRYPASSHTLFLHEVTGLRYRGLGIETASLHPPGRSIDNLPPDEAAEADTTFYLHNDQQFATALRILATIFAHPLVFLRGLACVASTANLTLRQRFAWLEHLAEGLLLGRWMKQRGLPHLHVHFGGPVATVGMLTSAAWGIPWSLTIHGPEELVNSDSYHLREKLDRASFVFCISDFCRSQLYQLTPSSLWPRFEVVRLGVDPVMLSPQSRTNSSAITGPGPRILEIVCVGRLAPAKGHLILLEALRLLRERGAPVRLTIVGAGPDRPVLDAFVALHKLDDQVTLTSALSHTHTLTHLRRADIFALASFSEGMPVSLMEAMALGLPCVSTSVAAIPELIRSGVDGLLVPPANPQALADAIESLASDSAFRKSLGQSARQRIISQYNLPLNQEVLAHSFAARLKASAG
jgi:colanic acid/amylovoran biosynthesis glycosyltransferase